MKIDPYHNRRRYEAWKATTARQGIPGLFKKNSEIIRAYLEDMEQGRNIAKGSRKGARSYIHLNNIRQRLIFIAQHLQERHNALLVEAEEIQVHQLFSDMRTGKLPKQNGETYRSTGNHVKTFKAFWHWHIKVQKKKGTRTPNICEDLDDTRPKGRWVYLTPEQVEFLCRHANFDRRTLVTFLYDSGIRSPTELVNIRINDLSEKCHKLRIRGEISKTFERTINLLLSPTILEEYIRLKGLKREDRLFPISPGVTNRYLKRLAKRLLGDEKSPGGAPYSSLTMYDFRHSSACYWRPRYKSDSALMYRFGWKRQEMIKYYTEFLGMKDTITPEDLHLPNEKTELEKRAEKAEAENQILQDKVNSMESQMKEILKFVGKLESQRAKLCNL